MVKAESYAGKMRVGTQLGSPEASDGRVARSRRTRERIVGALLVLVHEGNLRPTAAGIAERAGVSLRTIHQHFANVEALLVAATEELGRLAPPLAPTRVEGGGAKALVERFVVDRAAFLEATASMRRAAALHEATSPTVRRVARALRAERRRATEETFEPFLPPGGATRKDRLDALDAASTGALWDALRLDMDLSRKDAAAVMARLLAGVLAHE
jgi:TetR/AcrR family transcriptional regulator of autoinduction and epiphytic fitness